MPILVDDTSPFGRYGLGILHCRFHASMNQIYKAGWLGRRVFGRLRWLERLCLSRAVQLNSSNRRMASAGAVRSSGLGTKTCSA